MAASNEWDYVDFLAFEYSLRIKDVGIFMFSLEIA